MSASGSLKGPPAIGVTLLAALAISSLSGSKRVASWTTSLVSPRSLWSRRPRTRTIASGAITWALSASSALKTSISTCPSTSSRVANIIWLPLLVRIFLQSTTIPPTVTQAPSGFEPRAEIEQSTRARSAGPTSVSGCEER